MIRLSIIIVAFRSREELPACLGSLPALIEGGDVEVCVVNNSPGDGVAAWMAREYPAMRCLEPAENLGFGKANNVGFHATTGECVLFLNPDTISNATALAHGVRSVLADESIGAISPRLVLADGTMDLACRRSIPTLWDGFCRATGLAALFPGVPLFAGYNLTHLRDDGVHEVGAINGAFMLGRRAVFENVAGPSGEVFDEKFFMYGDDLDLCIRLDRAGYKIVYDGRERITHLKGLSVARDYDRMAAAIFDANRDVYLKHFNPRGSAWIRWKYTTAFGLWKRVARLRARLRGRRQVRPV